MNSEDVSEAYIKRTLTLLRAAEGEALVAAERLRKVHAQIRREVKKIMSDKNATYTDLKGLRQFVDLRLRTFYKKDWPEQLRNIEKEVLVAEMKWQEKTLSLATAEVVNTTSLSALSASARKKPYQGKTFTRWINGAFPADRKAVNNALTSGFNEGKNVQELVQDVSAVFGKVNADVKTISRSFFMHNAAEAKQKMMEVNPKLIQSVIWLSTLDSRTTPLICGVRDGKEYTADTFQPIGHFNSWESGPARIHWNCRSSYYPNIKGVNQTARRVQKGAGANYERGDNKTRTGRVRKGNKNERDRGLFKQELKTTRTNYESFLREQSKKNINFVADVLGSKEKARAFRDGKATLASLKLNSPVANTLKLADINR